MKQHVHINIKFLRLLHFYSILLVRIIARNYDTVRLYTIDTIGNISIIVIACIMALLGKARGSSFLFITKSRSFSLNAAVVIAND